MEIKDRLYMPATTEELGFHQLLLKGDPQASAVVCTRYLEELITQLRKANSAIPPDLLEEAAVDALFDYVLHPEHYQPTKKSLASFLYMAASGDLKNKLASLSRKAKKEMPLIFDVGNESTPGNELLEEVKAQSESDPDYIELVNKVIAFGKNPQEQAIIKTMIENERDFHPYAEILGLQGKPVEKQRDKVNQVKEKLRLRIRRSLEKQVQVKKP